VELGGGAPDPGTGPPAGTPSTVATAAMPDATETSSEQVGSTHHRNAARQVTLRRVCVRLLRVTFAGRWGPSAATSFPDRSCRRLRSPRV